MSAILAGSGLLAACQLTRLPWQGTKVSRIGFLAVGSREGRAPLIAAFLDGLRDLGYVDGQNVTIEYRFSGGQDDRLPDLAAELVALRVDVILASGTLAAIAASQSTTSIPIVMGASAAPVGTGLVATLARPGGNVTGISLLSPETAGKRLELLKAAIPEFSRLAVLLNEASPVHTILEREILAAAPVLGIAVRSLRVRRAQDLEQAFRIAQASGDQAVYPASDPLFTNTRAQLAELALRYRMPLMSDFRENVEAGALIAYGPVFATMYRRAASYVDRILKGANPAELPVEQPTNFELFVNATTARLLGLSIPQPVLQQATEIIQ
jgi:putative ABC transport system substrate-binding protein